MADNGDEVCPKSITGRQRHWWDGPFMNRNSRCQRCGVERTYAAPVPREGENRQEDDRG